MPAENVAIAGKEECRCQGRKVVFNLVHHNRHGLNIPVSVIIKPFFARVNELKTSNEQHYFEKVWSIYIKRTLIKFGFKKKIFLIFFSSQNS